MKKSITKKNVVQKVAAVAIISAAPLHKPNPQMRGPSKTFQQDGHWIEKPNVTAIIICICGNRYLKTRAGQIKCLRCTAVSVR